MAWCPEYPVNTQSVSYTVYLTRRELEERADKLGVFSKGAQLLQVATVQSNCKSGKEIPVLVIRLARATINPCVYNEQSVHLHTY